MKRHPKVLVRAFLAVVVAFGGLTGVSAPPAAADEPAPSLANYSMREANNKAELQDTVKKLDDQLPKLGIQNILDEAPRKGTTADGKACNPNAVAALKPEIDFSFCWDEADSANTANYEWIPQGMTTVADAQEDKHWGTAQPLIASWYHKPTGTAKQDRCKYKNSSGEFKEKPCVKGARISIIDPNTGKYAHVLLGYPFVNKSGNASYMSLRTKQTSKGGSLHAGGIAWYGNYLYVADTARGLRVFDTRYIFDLKAAGDKADITDKSKIGRQDGTFYSHGYRYLMPEINALTNNVPRVPYPDAKGDFACNNDSSPNTSFVSIDRSGTDHLITGEYCVRENGNTSGRVAAWPLDGNTGKPGLNATCRASPAQDPYPCWHADAAYSKAVDQVQGAVRYNGEWFLNQSRGDDRPGALIHMAQPPGEPTGELRHIPWGHYTGIGPEDLSYWPGSDANRSGLWTATEHAGKRMVYVTPAPENAGSLTSPPPTER